MESTPQGGDRLLKKQTNRNLKGPQVVQRATGEVEVATLDAEDVAEWYNMCAFLDMVASKETQTKHIVKRF